MLINWRDRLRRLRERLVGPHTDTPPPKQTTTRQAPLAINLGIDFGTSFTKVSFRDIGAEETGIVTFGSRSVEGTVLPSVVNIDRRGFLSLGTLKDPGDSAVVVRYLKMRLAHFAPDDGPHEFNKIDLDSNEAVRALSAWYLGTIISRARAWVLKHEAGRVKGRQLQWSANVGVPVEFCDSPAIDLFRQVLGVAWIWAIQENIPWHLDESISKYKDTARQTQGEIMDCHAIPEIAAAVQSFLISREAQPGVYIYFDIGGGTVDGVSFDYINRQGQRRINFYSGKVDPLGVAVVSNQAAPEDADSFEEALVNGTLNLEGQDKLVEWAKKLQLLVANVIMTAKKKDTTDWQREQFQYSSGLGKRLMALDISQMVPLIVFLGGGGASSNWYQRSILSTYHAFGHLNAGIPPYQLREVPKPSDLDMGSLEEEAFRRFAIAYGLSIPYGEGPEISLPSEFEPVERKKPREQDVVEYIDTKDVYDK